MEAMKRVFEERGLEVPEGMLKLFEDVGDAGAAGRRRVYGRLFEVVRAAGVVPKRKRRVMWPEEVRAAVRAVVDEGEQDAGAYDSQYKEDDSAHHFTLEELANVNWDTRPLGGGKIKKRK